MKKIILGLLIVVTMSMAQTAGGASTSSGALSFNSGDHQLGVGLNLDYGWGVGAAVAWDYCMKASPMFSLGAEMGLAFNGYDFYTGTSQENYLATNLEFQFRFGFHPFAIPATSGKVAVANVLDPYVVLHMGPGFAFDNYDYAGYETDTDGYFTWGIALGVRWMFSDNVGLWGELDWDRFIVGVNFKF